MLQELYLDKRHIRRHCSKVKSCFWDYLEQKTKEAMRRLLSDGIISTADVAYLINYLFKGGPPPGC
ncbi:MAG: hypothetical protein AMJ73_04345 [candidate division Zixibacteria bacterium SM1_73]|nr:MAG: hypothetical protein AMJ73_04345 [candidate division Zixibacteria bacterium SM1_73]